MNKISYLFLSGILFTTSSFSSSALDFLKHKPMSTLVAPKSKTLQENHFANFSGEWKGVCTSETDEYPIPKLTIQQDDFFMHFTLDDGEFLTYEINSVETTTYATKNHHFTRENGLHWDKEGNALILTSFLSDLGNYAGLLPVATEMTKSTWQLINDQLIIKIDEHRFEDTDVFTDHLVCTLSKVEK